MLDQNTDRMWFVIGAVIVGAAIIFIANGTLPTLFASVSDSFEEAANKGPEVIEGLHIGSPNFIHGQEIHYGRWVHPDGTTELRTDSSGEWHATVDYMPVIAGNTYRFKTEVQSWNKRIVYYDSAKNNIGGQFYDGYTGEVSLKAPSNAAYARVSTRYLTEAGVPVDLWYFGQ